MVRTAPVAAIWQPTCSSSRKGGSAEIVVGMDGLEPSTLRLSGVRSNHLSYMPSASTVRVACNEQGRAHQLMPREIGPKTRSSCSSSAKRVSTQDMIHDRFRQGKRNEGGVIPPNAIQAEAIVALF